MKRMLVLIPAHRKAERQPRCPARSRCTSAPRSAVSWPILAPRLAVSWPILAPRLADAIR